MTKTPVESHFDNVSGHYDEGKEKYDYYYSNLKKLLGDLIPPNNNVLEIGCGTGDLLVSLNPKKGMGYDVSAEMIKIAKYKYNNKKNLNFTHNSLFINHNSYDFIFLSDVIEHLENPKKEFQNIAKIMNSRTKLVITMANPIWEPLLMMWEKMGLKMREGPHYRIKNYELRIMIEKLGMMIVKHDYKLLIPVKIPFITNIANIYLEKYFKRLCFIEYFVLEKV